MSSILKALNRLKNEAPKQDETPSWPQKIDMKRAVRSERKKRGRVKKLGYSGAIVVLLIGMGWLVYSQKPHLIKRILPWDISSKTEDKDKEKAKDLSDQRDPARTRVAIRKRASSSSGKPTSIGRKAALPRNLFQKEVLEHKTPDKPKAPKLPPEAYRRPPPAQKGKGLSGIREGRSETKLSRPILSQGGAVSKKYSKKTGPNSRSSDKTGTSLETSDDSKFKLQAIAWSDDPKKRIAVINDHVIKEGASIEGVRVIRIGRDEVLIREGGKIYKLAFGLR